MGPAPLVESRLPGYCGFRMVTFDAHALRMARESAGLSRHDLAARCACSHRTIENAETGGREPRGSFVAAIARALNVDMSTFYRFDDRAAVS